MEYFYLFFAVQFFYIFRLLVGKSLLLGGKSTTLVTVLNAASVIRHRYTVCCYDDTRVLIQKVPVTSTDAEKNHLSCTLDQSTQDLINLIFDADMFNDAMKNLEIGTLCRPTVLI